MEIMKTKKLLLITFLILNTAIFGQICGTLPIETSKNTQKTVTNSQFLSSSNSICINVYYHIVRENNGNGGLNSNQLDNITNTLNAAYNEHNLYINSLGFDYINNSTYYNINDTGNSTTEFDALVQINNLPNAINIYIVNDAISYAGKANGILSQALVIERNYANTQVTSHEVGHCLDLWHTFHGSIAEPPSSLDPNACPELINGNNCSSCGDYVCDTPADANTGNSGGYTPDMDNIMSYYYPFNHFSNGQAVRIRQAFASSSLLQQVVSNNCSIAELSSIDNLCFTNDKTITISNLGNNTTSWQVSSNISIIPSPTNNSITIKALNSTSSGNGWVKATLSNGTILQENFAVGVPYDYNNWTIAIHPYPGNTPSGLYLNN